MHRWNSDSEGKFYDSKLLMNNSFRDCRNEYNGSPRNKQHSLKCTVNEVGTSDHNYSHLYPLHFFLRGVGTFLTSRFSSSLPKRLVFVLSSTYAKFLVWEVKATVFVTHLVWPSRDSTFDLPTGLSYRSLASWRLLLRVPTYYRS